MIASELAVLPIAALAIAVLAYFVWQYYRERDLERATDRTADGVLGIAVGMAVVVASVGSSIADAVGEIGTLLASVPDLLMHLTLTVAGWAGLSGTVESITPNTFLVIAGIVLVSYYAIREG